MAHIFSLWDLAEERCSYSLRAGLCLLRTASFYWAIVSLAWGWGERWRGREAGRRHCERVCSELPGCGSDTSGHRGSSVPHLRGRGAGKRWHRGVMKKCLCVRGLKNSPFRVVRLLAEQRQGPFSEICCKDYLVCILYQGTAKQNPPFFFFFLRLDLAVAAVFLGKDSSFSVAFLQWAHVLSGPFSLCLHSSSNLSLPPKKRQLLIWQKNKGGRYL